MAEECSRRSGCTHCAGCPLAVACRAGKCERERKCEAAWWPVYVFYTLLAFCVIRYGVTALSESMHLRPDYDANIYHIIGRGWMDGVLPYVGLSDLKGPLVFLQCGLGSLLTPDSFLGVSVLHSMVVGLGLLYACKSAALLVGRVSAMAVGGVMFVYTLYFSIHPSVTVLTLQYISMYHVLRRIVRGESISGWAVYATGAFVALALLLKFNLVVFWVPIGVYMLHGSGWIRRLGQMAAGFATIMLPMVAYMSSAGMLAACWQEYVHTAVQYGSVGPAASALVQQGWRLLAQVVPDHLYMALPLGLNALLALPLVLPWLILPLVVKLRYTKAYYGVFATCFLLGAIAIFGGEHHFLHYFFSFFPYYVLSLLFWLLLLRRLRIWARLLRMIEGACMLLPLLVVAVAVLLPRYVDVYKPEKGLQESRMATAALAERVQGNTFLCTDAEACLNVYRLAGAHPPICHFVPQMTPQGRLRHREEMLHCLRTVKPRYLVCTRDSAPATEKLIAESGVAYRLQKLLPPDFPPYPPTADYAPFCLYEAL